MADMSELSKVNLPRDSSPNGRHEELCHFSALFIASLGEIYFILCHHSRSSYLFKEQVLYCRHSRSSILICKRHAWTPHVTWVKNFVDKIVS